jgi:tetratricopeptide (TPR) repeat protein
MMIFGSRARKEKKIADCTARARELHGKGDQLGAIRAYHEALEAGRPNREIDYQLAILNAEVGRPAIAADLLHGILAAEPGHEDARYMLGAVYYDLGRYQESAALCRHALATRPTLLQAHFTLGMALSQMGEFKDAAASFARVHALRRGDPWDRNPAEHLAEAPSPEFDGRQMAVSAVKLSHDCEQLELLLAAGKLPPAFGEVLTDYRNLLAEVVPSSQANKQDFLEPFDAGRHPLVARTYKRPLYIDRSEAPRGPILNPDTDWSAAQARYLASDPSLTVVDGLLSAGALAALRRFCAETTVWNDIKVAYLGAYLEDGFAPELMLRIAAELRERLPGVIRDFPLQNLWAYKYDSALQGTGIGLHGDTAAVNVNFWITPDEANLDPDHGGLLVHPHKAPPDWNFLEYNADWRKRAIVDFLEARHSEPVCVPYRCNRAVIFDSDLFHATDAPRFREGYTNRRINVTLLYGQRRTAIGS